MSSKLILRIVFWVSLLLLTQTVLVAWAQEANPLPTPTGPYAVGVEWRHWVDESRDETFGAEPHGKREMMVTFLYPVDAPAEGEAAAYLANSDLVLPEFSNVMTLVNVDIPLDSDDIAGFVSHAVPNAPLSDDQPVYPILVFSPGAGAAAAMYSTQIEELASQGYIVAAIDHAYSTSAIVFPDGHTVKADFSQGLEAAALVGSQDQRFVIDQLEAMSDSDPEGTFTGRLDLEQLGVFGQSNGGSASVITCQADARCKALAIGDSDIHGDAIEQGLDQPTLYLLSDSRWSYNPAAFTQWRGPLYLAAFAGFEHLDFGDFPLWESVQPFRDTLWLGTVEPARAVELTRAYLVAFFDKYLKGADDTLLDVPSEAHPEVTIEASNVPSIAGAQTASSEEAHREALLRVAAEGLTLGDATVLEQFIADDYVVHSPFGDLGRDDVRGLFDALRAAMTNFNVSRENMVAEGDSVAMRTILTGTFENDFNGPFGLFPPTGQPFRLEIVNIFQFNDDSTIQEEWAQFDTAAFMAQLGAMPTPTAETEEGGISEAEAMAFAERFNAIFAGPNLDIANEIMAEDFVGHLPLAPELDRQGWKDYVASFYAGLPDVTETVNQVIVGKDRVVLYVTYTGTHDGDFFGIPATGNSVTFDGIGIFRFDENGLAVENWAVVDVVGILAQIGGFPPAQ